MKSGVIASALARNSAGGKTTDKKRSGWPEGQLRPVEEFVVFFLQGERFVLDPVAVVEEAKRAAAKGQAHVVPYGERRCKEHQHDWLTFDDLRSTFAKTGAEIVKLRDETALVRWQRVPAGESLAGLQTIQDAVYIPGFVAAAGSTVNKGEGQDLDLILRARGRDESLEVLLRNEIQTALGRRVDLHYTYNAAGPHGPHLPIYDLVLARRPTIELVDVPVVERAKAAERVLMPPAQLPQRIVLPVTAEDSRLHQTPPTPEALFPKTTQLRMTSDELLHLVSEEVR